MKTRYSVDIQLLFVFGRDIIKKRVSFVAEGERQMWIMSLFKDSPKNQIIEFLLLIWAVYYCHVSSILILVLIISRVSLWKVLKPLQTHSLFFCLQKCTAVAVKRPNIGQTTRKRKEDSLFHSLMINMESCQDLPNLPTVNQLILGIKDSLNLLSKWSSLNFFNCFTFSTRLH